MFYRALRQLLSTAQDFPPGDRALPIQFWCAQESINLGAPRLLLNGFNADRPFCGHERWRQLAYSYSKAYNPGAPSLSSSEKARILGLPSRELTADDLRTLEALGFSGGEYRQWVDEYCEERIAHIEAHKDLDFLQLVQLLSEEEIGTLWADEHLLMERRFGLTFISPFGVRDIVKLGFALPLGKHFVDTQTKRFLWEVLRDETGLECEKRAFPSPMRFWAISLRAFSVLEGARARSSFLRTYLKNLLRGGRDYALSHRMLVLLAWVESLRRQGVLR
jgi:hypothetical protein